MNRQNPNKKSDEAMIDSLLVFMSSESRVRFLSAWTIAGTGCKDADDVTDKHLWQMARLSDVSVDEARTYFQAAWQAGLIMANGQLSEPARKAVRSTIARQLSGNTRRR